MRLPTPRLFSGLRSALRPAMPRFKVSALWLLVLAWIFLLVWIWWKGPAWTLYDEYWLKPLANRWLATATWGLIALAWLTVSVMKRLQQLERQQKQQREETLDPLSIELNAQQRYLDRWLLRLQRHLDSRRYLWQLPWYMVIGPAGSGKTALLREGFPSDIIYTPEAVRGVEQRLYITPHVGKQAVIFDADGILCEQPDADVLHRRLWEHWLGWLVQKRARQPLNGLILTLDLPDLLTADKRRREHLVQILRSRLQDIRQHLHCQLPVYVVLTRLDLLHGFAALFRSLDRRDRDAILGVTFTRRAHENDDWRTELNAFWLTWGEQLNNALPALMLPPGSRSSLFSFVRQMQGCREPLTSLLDGLLDGENMDVMLRGVYLTSSLQRGQIDDIFMQSAARQFRLGSSPMAAWPLVDTAPYFTRNLFVQSLLAEPNLASENRIWLMQSHRKLSVFSATGGIAALLLIAGWHHYYNSNWQSGVTVLKQAKAFMDVPPPQGMDDYGNLQLPLLNPVRDATLAYGNWGDRSRFADLGLYQGRNIGPYVEQTYLQLLAQRYLPSLFNGLVKEMNAAPPESEEKLAVLRVIRMLEDKSGRNNEVVKQYMAKRWSNKFHGQRDIQAQLMAHTAQGAATVWLTTPDLDSYGQRLQQISDVSPLQPLETGTLMTRTADSRWPESLQQQQATAQWNTVLKTHAQSSPQMKGWQQARQNLREFADLMMQRETEQKGFTLSYIKTVTWQAERLLNQETPLEYLLTQYQDARARKQNTDALEKEINERLDGVLSRWLLLKNNTLPETATDTTPENNTVQN